MSRVVKQESGEKDITRMDAIGREQYVIEKAKSPYIKFVIAKRAVKNFFSHGLDVIDEGIEHFIH